MTTTATDRTGDLCDADTGELIGPATFEQITDSRWAATTDGGAGAIDVDGRRCYVEGDDDPALELCMSTEWVREWLEGHADLTGIDDVAKDMAADEATTDIGDRLTAAGFAVGPAKSGRRLLSQWNGCRLFSYRSGPVATFATLAEWEQQTIDKIVAEAAAAALADIVAEQHAPGCSCVACWTSEHNAATRGAE